VLARPSGQRKKQLLSWSGQTMVRFWTSRVDEKRRRLYVVGVVDSTTGASEAWYHPLLADGSIGARVKIADLPTWTAASGFDLDVVGDRGVIYGGGDTITWMNLDTGTLTPQKTLNPPPTTYGSGQTINPNGTFGRMRFSQNLQALIFLQDMFTGAWIYRVR